MRPRHRRTRGGPALTADQRALDCLRTLRAGVTLGTPEALLIPLAARRLLGPRP